MVESPSGLVLKGCKGGGKGRGFRGYDRRAVEEGS